MTTHKDEIVERLRQATPRTADSIYGHAYINPDGPAAADLIEQQASTIERMRDTLSAMVLENDAGQITLATSREARALTNKERMADDGQR